MKEQLLELREKISKLNKQEIKLRDKHLRDISTGKIQGPMTGFSSIDKDWLKNYKEEDILKDINNDISIYDYVFDKKNSGEALNYFGRKISYQKLEKEIEIFAKKMISIGIKEKDIVTVCMPNTPEAVIAFYALNKIGAVANMIHPLSSENEIKYFINEVNSKLVITIDSSAEKINKIINDTNLESAIIVSPSDSMPLGLKTLYNLSKKEVKIDNDKFVKWNEFNKLTKQEESIKLDTNYDNDQTSVILHTGGTTGHPKGVQLSNKNFNAMVEQFISNASNFKKGDRMLTIMPVFHGFGLCSSLHLPLSMGVSSILIPKLDAKKIDQLFKKYKPNHILGVPTLFKAIIKNKKMQELNLSYVKYIVSGGDLVKDSLEQEINEFFEKRGAKTKLSKGYGLSEVVAGVTFSFDDCNSYGSIGVPMIKSNIRISEFGTDKELSNGEIGEICVQGPTIMKGYYKNEKESKDALKNEWLHTGDLGYYDNGEFYFSSRKGNMIITSGVNVYPNVIEQVIENHESIAACAVIGVPHPYKIRVPKAYIVLKEGYEASDELINELKELCEKNLNVYSTPYSYEIRERLPQTLLGKISHKELKEEQSVVRVLKK